MITAARRLLLVLPPPHRIIHPLEDGLLLVV